MRQALHPTRKEGEKNEEIKGDRRPRHGGRPSPGWGSPRRWLSPLPPPPSPPRPAWSHSTAWLGSASAATAGGPSGCCRHRRGRVAVAAGCASPPTPVLRHNAPTDHAPLPPLPPYIPSASPPCAAPADQSRGVARRCGPLRHQSAPLSWGERLRLIWGCGAGLWGAPCRPGGVVRKDGMWMGKTRGGLGKNSSFAGTLWWGDEPPTRKSQHVFLHLFFSLFRSGCRKSLGFISCLHTYVCCGISCDFCLNRRMSQITARVRCCRKVKKSFPNGVIARCMFYPAPNSDG